MVLFSFELTYTRGIQKLMQLVDFLGISYLMLLKIDRTPKFTLRPINIWKKNEFW